MQGAGRRGRRRGEPGRDGSTPRLPDRKAARVSAGKLDPVDPKRVGQSDPGSLPSPEAPPLGSWDSQLPQQQATACPWAVRHLFPEQSSGSTEARAWLDPSQQEGDLEEIRRSPSLPLVRQTDILLRGENPTLRVVLGFQVTVFLYPTGLRV